MLEAAHACLLYTSYGRRTAVICGDYLLAASLRLAAQVGDRERYLDLRLPDYVAVSYTHLNPARVRKVMAKLKKAGLVATKEGVDGGYHFIKAPAEVTLRRIDEADVYKRQPEDQSEVGQAAAEVLLTVES